jgi:predicted lipoprotein with Yx(FWY)xxD motif
MKKGEAGAEGRFKKMKIKETEREWAIDVNIYIWRGDRSVGE